MDFLLFALVFLFIQIKESFLFAWSALRQNMLRTFLSLLGVTIGIFAIISVYTVVDSLEKNLKQSLSFLGSDVIYVEKWPWTFTNPNYAWWDFWKRPTSNYEEFTYLQKAVDSHSGMAIFRTKGGNTVKYGSNSIEGVALQGVTYSFNLVSDVKVREGRYFSEREIKVGKNVALIGHDIAENLFPNASAVGKDIKIRGHKFRVIGVLEKVGQSMMNMGANADLNCLTSLFFFDKLFSNSRYGPEGRLSFKGKENDEGLEQLESEITFALRRYRGIKPSEKDNFAVNRPEMITGMVTSIFDAISVAATIIGLFSILVGGFGIANIMFVSVKERTNIIGIQKSLGARNYFILSQFLFEAILLSLIGGICGLFLVFLITLIPQDVLTLYMSTSNMITGILISSIIGVLSGLIPAVMAAKLDPVIAIRSK